MNKNAIKKFAIEARNKLRSSVADKAGMLGITEDGCSEAIAKGADFEVYMTAANSEITLNKKQCEQRKKLVEQITAKGFDAVVEEVAYTWFNRICAVRFMEVNDYLPTRVRVLSSEKEGKSDPDMITAAPDIDLDFTEEERNEILDHKMSGDTDWLFRMLFIKQCNKLSEVLPELFEKTSDYTEILFQVSYVNQDDVIQMLIGKNGVPEEDFNVSINGQEEIIGWLYQYYNEERKNEVINIFKGTVKKEDIPAATQLFTTDWVVRYMVDNSLGRYWIERNPESKLRDKLKFFVAPKSGDINYTDEKIAPTELTFLDPCMGSGHILVYAFEVLMEIYRECGYSDRDAALAIVENNLYGLDIDDRAYQLAYFAVMMKARSYNRRALTQGITHNLCAIQESNGINTFACEGVTKDKEQNIVGEYLINMFKDAKELGSLISVERKEYKNFAEYLMNVSQDGQIDMFQSEWYKKVQPLCLKLAKQADVLSAKYCVVVTNPPYLGKMQGQLKKFVTDNYKDYSGDLFAIFMYHNFGFCMKNGYSAFMTPFVWMFIKTYEKLREYIINNKNITTLVQMEYSAFEEATVPICSFVLKNCKSEDKSLCIRLSDFKGGMEVQKDKVLEALNSSDCEYFYTAAQCEFEKIPGSPVAYWVSEAFISAYERGRTLGSFSNVSEGIKTGDNNRFLRLWFEVEAQKFSFSKASKGYKWYAHHKGGEFRKWYGNLEYVINWENDGSEIKSVGNSGLQGRTMYFEEFASWSKIGSKANPLRYYEKNVLFDSGAPAIANDRLKETLALFNTKVGPMYLRVIAPTINLQVGDVKMLPLLDIDNMGCCEIVDECIALSRTDWDSFETSWDFAHHPLVSPVSTIADAYTAWQGKCEPAEISEEALDFGTFCIQALAERLEIPDEEVYILLTEKTNLLDEYIIKHWEVLHTQGKEYIVEDLMEVLQEKGGL